MEEEAQFDPRQLRKGHPSRRLRHLVLCLELRADADMLDHLAKSLALFASEPERMKGPLFVVEAELVESRIEALVARLEKRFKERALVEAELPAEDAYRESYAGPRAMAGEDMERWSPLIRRLVFDGWRPYVQDPETYHVHPNPDPGT